MNYKAILLATALILVGTNQAGAQTLKEKLAAKLEAAREKLNGESGGGTAVAAMPTESQLEIAAKWESGKYTFFKVDGRYIQKKGSQGIQINKDENGKVTQIQIGNTPYELENEKYNPYSFGGTEFICAFVLNNMYCVYMTDEMVVFYGCNSSYKVDQIHGTLKSKKSPAELIKEIQAYRDYGSTKIESDRDALAEEEKIHRSEFTLEGKDVVKITPVYPKGIPTSIGSSEKLEIGFEIKLADGTIMKTSNIGGEAYVEDLIAESMNAGTSGIGSNYRTGLYGGYGNTNAYLRARISDYSKDYISVTVKSKYGGNATCQIKLPISYNSKESYGIGGSSGGDSGSYGGSGGDGSYGGDITGKIKATKHSETGEKLYYCQVDGQYYKIKNGGSFHVNAAGGNGGKGGPGRDVNGNGGMAAPTNGGLGGDGGNGGSVTFLIDPSAKDIKVTYNVAGGNGGSGGVKGECFSCAYGQSANHGSWGNGGSAGHGSKTIQSVSF